MAQKVLNFNQCVDLIKNVGPKRSVIIMGENGIAKTALARHLARQPEFADFITPEPLDCTQMSDGSIWMPDIDKALGVSRELPNERFGVNRENQKGIKGAKKSLICFDEVFKVQQFIKNMIAPILYENRIGDYYLVPGSITFGCTNLAIEGLGDSLQPHLRSRLILVTMRKPTQQEWKENFALPNGLNPAVIAYTEMYPQVFESFLDYEPGGDKEGKPLERENPRIFNPRVMQDGFASPRTLHAAAEVVDEMDKLDSETLQLALEGTVGSVTAGEMAAFVRFQQELTAYERVVADPKKAPLTSNPTAQLVQVFQFITRTKTREEASAVVTYVKRMRDEMQTLFCTNVANSQRIVTFANAPGFNEMLAANKIYLGGVK